uniref:Uncharacterized protein n=1 Tax=Anguilla anguilla TaxID=7936 RepID=A0A0E9TU73_ANGAN
MVWKNNTDMISAALQHELGCLKEGGEVQIH